jgi:hypothetical protein
MVKNNDQQTRFLVYGSLLVLVLAGGVYYYLTYYQVKTDPATVATEQKQQLNYDAIDSAVLDSKKFRELKEVKVPESQVQTPTSTKPTEIDNDKLSKLPRKKGNPFIPSF